MDVFLYGAAVLVTLATGVFGWNFQWSLAPVISGGLDF